MRTTPINSIPPAATALVKRGYKQIKTQMAIGGLSDAQEIERIRLIRETVGPDIALMADINQRWKAHETISIGRRIEDIGFAWLEDPIAPTDYQGLAKVADALATPVCAGEYLYGIEPFQQLMRHGSVDIVMIDLLRVGGVTPWMKVAGMAEAFNRRSSAICCPRSTSIWSPHRRMGSLWNTRRGQGVCSEIRRSTKMGSRTCPRLWASASASRPTSSRLIQFLKSADTRPRLDMRATSLPGYACFEGIER